MWTPAGSEVNSTRCAGSPPSPPGSSEDRQHDRGQGGGAGEPESEAAPLALASLNATLAADLGGDPVAEVGCWLGRRAVEAGRVGERQ